MSSTNHFISLQQAIDLTTRFRKEKENVMIESMRGQKILPVCETFERNAFDSLLRQSDCQKLRFYLGMDETMKVKIVAVGVDSSDKDILPSLSKSSSSESAEEGVIEDGQRCPDFCPPPSPLNS
jgi:hypothetical protein